MRSAVTKPRILGNFETYNDGRPVRKQMRPFNFMMVAQQKRTVELAPTVLGRCALIAPYESNSARWSKLEWFDHYDPTHRERYRITTDEDNWRYGREYGLVLVRSYRDIFHEYRDSTESKALGPDGQPCAPGTIGLLQRRTVHASSIISVGKEMAELEEYLSGLRDARDVEEFDRHGNHDQLVFEQLARPALLRLGDPIIRVASASKLDRDTVSDALAGGEVRDGTARKMIRYAIQRVKQPGERDESALKRFLETDHGRTCRRPGCERPARPRSDYCSDTHRKAAWEADQSGSSIERAAAHPRVVAQLEGRG